MTAEILYADTGLALGTYENVIVTVLDEPSTMERLRHLRRHVERFRKSWIDRNCGLTVLSPGSMELNMRAEIREESTSIARDNPSPGSTLVVEGTGFGASATRAFLSGLFLVSRNRSKIHGTVEDAAAWLAPVASGLAKKEITAAQLVAAVNATRASLEKRD
jgi:hypothetical protein